MAKKPISETTEARIFLSEEEKKVIRDFNRQYEDLYGKALSIPHAISEIVIQFGQISKSK